ncbi:MAG TPA: hypothetical protein DCQ93_09260 [Bacteroidetes bacterium]|nr:hypothetical protein [Bacteroidota bacterium]
MKGRLRSTIQIIIFLFIGGFLFWLAFRDQNLSEIKDSIAHSHYGWILPVLIFAFLSNLSRSVRWNMLIHPIGYKPKTFNTFSAVLIGYFANLLVPRLGEITRCTVLNRYEKIPMQSLLGTVLAERVIDVLTLLVILALVIMLQFELLSAFVIRNLFNPLADKINSYFQHSTTAYIIAGAVFLVLIVVAWRVLLQFKSTKFYIKFLELLRGFFEGFNTVRRLRSKWLFLAHTFFIWVCYIMMSYLCFFCFDFTASFSFLKGVTAMVFGGIGFVVPVQGGIGAYHYIVRETMMVYGLSEEQGLSFATLCHGAQIGGIIVFGALCFVLLPVFNRKKSEADATA